MKSREPVQLGRGVSAGFPTAKDLDAQLAECERAQAMAQDAGARDMVLEAQYVASLARWLKALHLLLVRAARGRNANAELVTLRQASQDMAAAFDAKTDLVEAEPKSFAESIKKLHAELWEKRVGGLEAGLAGM